jgi:hypothetical protein
MLLRAYRFGCHRERRGATGAFSSGVSETRCNDIFPGLQRVGYHADYWPIAFDRATGRVPLELHDLAGSSKVRGDLNRVPRSY